MSPLAEGLVAGLGFGTLSVVIMVPISFADKRRALAASFASRFAIGLLIPAIALPFAGWAVGAMAGLVISLADAIVTRSYAPILATGALGGALIGWLTL